MAQASELLEAQPLAVHAEAAARLLKALANSHRLQVMCLLDDEELSVGELNEQIPLSQSALSQHLKVLRDDGLVSCRRASQTVYYRVTAGPALDLIKVLHAHFCSQAPKARATTRRK